FVYVPSQAKNLNLGFTSLNTDFVSRRFRTIKNIYVLRTLFPNYCFHLESDQLAVSCFLRFPDQGISVPWPPSNGSICTLHSLLKSPSSLEQHLRKHLEQIQLRQPGLRISLPLAT
ncbi:hypothetical protein ILYODFUR_021900, partial [Ilyodon furcidens]